AVGAAIFTEADDIESLREHVRDAVRCHFEEDPRPHVIRLVHTGDDALGDCRLLDLPRLPRFRRSARRDS
ncbi:MAG: hypothetical protein ACRDHF_19920, partial [Tepidiformaceae bacterium]